jgi:hypothetical protein
MPQIKTSLAFIALCLGGALALSGCGDRNSQAVFSPDSGKHLANWLPSGHKETARADIAVCVECHGEDLSGGISKVGCTTCHIGNALSVHPQLWGNFAYAFHADYVKKDPQITASCALAICHGTDLLGGANPRLSCAVNCHMAGTAQAPQKHAWVAATRNENIIAHKAYFANGRDYSTCRNNACHGGANTTPPPSPPGVFLSGPACLSSGCHGSGNPVPAETN